MWTDYTLGKKKTCSAEVREDIMSQIITKGFKFLSLNKDMESQC